MSIRYLLPAVMLAACAAPDNAAQTGRQGEVLADVQALILPDATDILYDLTLTNGASQTVWTETAISANQYGTVDGSGSFTFFGPCDADSPAHTLTVSVNDLSGLAADEWVNPGPLDKAFTCSEDATTRVNYDITVLVDGEQGFSDVAVDFDDLFCSASVACDAEGIQDASGSRIPSAVLSMACTAGDDPITGATPDTVLYMDDLVVDCGGDGDATINPAPTNDGIDNTPNGAVLSHSVARRNLNGQDAQTTFWQVILGLDVTKTCTLTTRATASNGALTAQTTPADTSWPVIDVDVDLTSGGALTCTSHPLTDTENVGDVHISYVGDGDADGSFAGQAFQYEYDDPAGAPAPLTYVQLVGKNRHICGRVSDGTVRCWGQWVNYGGAYETQPSVTDSVKISVSRDHGCSMDSNGDLTCWGDPSYFPTGETGLIDFAVGVDDTCVIRGDGSVECWGTNTWGELDHPTITDGAAIYQSGYNVTVLRDSDVPISWGRSVDNTLENIDTAVRAGDAFSQELEHACWLLSGVVSCSGKTDGRATPPTNSGTLFFNTSHKLGALLNSDGTVTTWAATGTSEPDVSGMSNGAVLGLNHENVCLVDSAGTITCAGPNNYGDGSPPTL